MPRITYLKTEYSFVMWERLTPNSQNFVLLEIATSTEVKTMIVDGVEGYDIIETPTQWTVVTPGLEPPKLIRQDGVIKEKKKEIKKESKTKNKILKKIKRKKKLK